MKRKGNSNSGGQLPGNWRSSGAITDTSKSRGYNAFPENKYSDNKIQSCLRRVGRS